MRREVRSIGTSVVLIAVMIVGLVPFLWMLSLVFTPPSRAA
jgi:ABC-type glycerol-3-phosphate transport system permease component